MIEVLSPGALTTIQDLGRPGWAHLGVSRSGAADRGALALANRLAGNPEGAAALETSLQGPRLRAGADATVVLAGAPCDARLGDSPVAMHVATAVRAGQELVVGRALRGVRTYVAFAGGIDVAPVLGGRGTDTLGGLGPAPLRRGDRFALGAPQAPPPPVDAVPVADDPVAPLRVALLLGPREDWFDPGDVAALRSRSYAVTAASDRVGVRLEGGPLRRVRDAELRSEGIVPGAVQVPPSGQPIVLLADHPTTGGYPVIGVVPAADLDRIAQLRPGAHLRLVPAPI